MRSRFLVSLFLLILLAGSFLPAGPVTLAHPIVVDAGPADWTMAQPTNLNTGHIGRNAAREGEYIWRDNPNDERTDFASPDPRVDMLQFRVTADETYLYFGVLMSDIDQATGDGAPMVQVAIDLDRQNGSGESWLGGFSDTQVSSQAEWEYLVLTRFGSGTGAPKVFDNTWTDLVNGNTSLATNAISDTNNFIEIRVRWNVLGFTSARPTTPLRFTVASFRANANDDTWDTGGSGTSNALDAVTNYGDPGTLSNTWSEVSDGVVNYYFDVWFQQQCTYEPAGPILISEVIYDPATAEPANEWIEIVNVSPMNISLETYKLGDEEQTNGTEGMYYFPSGATIAPGQVVIVANSATAFQTTYGFYPDYEFVESTSAVPNMSQYVAWSTGTTSLVNTGDEIILLDGSDTAIDVVTYESGVWPGVTAHPGPPANSPQTIGRLPANNDTNDCSLDFVVQTDAPGTASFNQPDVAVVKTGPTTVNAGQTITYTISYVVSSLAPLTSARITDDLPDDVTYVGYAANPPISLISGPDPLVWNGGTLCGFWTGRITVTADVADTVSQGTVLTNTAEISATGDVISNNNLSILTTTVVGPELAISKVDNPDPVAPGALLTYTLTVINQSTLTANGIVITDTVPPSTTFAWAGEGGALQGGTVVWNTGMTLTQGASLSVSFAVTVNTGLPNYTILTNERYGVSCAETPAVVLGSPVTTTVVAGCEPPYDVDFTSDSPVLLGNPMHFSAQASGSQPFTYTWTFGGPGSGSGLDTATPVFTYSVTGTFSVQLTVGNACGSAGAGHDVTVFTVPPILINELDSDTPGTDVAEFVELYDGGAGNTSLDGLVVVFYNGSNDLSYYAADLDTYSTDADGYFVLGNAAVPGVDLVFANNLLQNGQDAVALYVGDAADFPNGTPVTTTNLVDAIVYDTSDPDDPGLLILLNPGQPQVDENGRSNSANDSVSRCPNGSGGPRNTYTYVPTTPSPDGPNQCPAPELAISKVDNPDPVAPGALLTYTLTIANQGEATANGIVITDTVPPSTTFAWASDGGALQGGTVVWNTGMTLTQGSSLEVSFAVTVDAGLPDYTILTNERYGVSCTEVMTVVLGSPVTTTVMAGCLPPYDVDFTSDSPVLLGNPMHFSAQASGSQPFTYTWSFGGPGSGSGLDTATPVFTYSVTGTFSVQLTVGNACGSAGAGHDVTVFTVPPILINEFDAQTPGTDAAEFVELYGPPNASLDGLVVVFFNGGAANDASYYAADLDGYSTDANGYFVLGNTAVPGVDLVFANNLLQNGQDAIGLFAADATDFPNGTPVTNTNLIDAVVYDDFPPGVDDPPLRQMLLNPGQPMVFEGDDANNDSAGRCPNGSGGPRNTYTYMPLDPSPDGPNGCEVDAGITKSGPLSVIPGERITYTLAFAMNTSFAGTNLVITDDLPDEVAFVAFTSDIPITWTGTTDPLVFTLPSLPGDQGGHIWVEVEVDVGLPFNTVLTNTAQITCSGDADPSNNTAIFTSTVVGTEVGIQKTGSAFAWVGGPISYTLTYQVQGDPAQDVIITDVLPVVVSYTNDTAPVAPTFIAPNTYVWNLGTVSETGSFVINGVVIEDPGTWTVQNQAWITASNDGLPAGNYDDHTTILPMPIQEIQYTTDPGDGTYPSPHVGESVWTIGAVIAEEDTFPNPNIRIFVQDPWGDGPWDGLYLFYAGAGAPDVNVGDLLLVYGTVAEYNGVTELATNAANTTVLANGVAIAPAIIPTADLVSGVVAESYESVLVQFSCAVVTRLPDQYGEWGVTDASGVEATVDDWATYAYSPTLGDNLTLLGVGNYSFGAYKLEPRGDADIALAAGVTDYGPLDGDVPVNTTVWATFNMEMNADTINTATFLLEGPAGPVAGAVSYDPGTRTATFVPDAALDYAATYTATLTTEIESADGTPLCAEYSWSFTTVAAPGPDLRPSRKTADPPDPPNLHPGDTFTYTIILENGGEITAAAVLTDVLPAEVTVLTATLPPGMVYDGGQLLWSGDVAPTQVLPLSFQAVLNAYVPIGTVVTNLVWIDDGVHLFTRTASLMVSGVPDVVVSPPSLSVMLPPEQSTVRDLTVGNVGQETLYWNLLETPPVNWLSENPTSGSIPAGGQTVVAVTFDAAGLAPDTYTATLTLISNDPDEPAVEVAVTLVVTTSCIPVSDPEFTWLPLNPSTGEVITFDGTAGGMEPITYTWSFGDGGTGMGASAQHTYTQAGAYTVVMTATNCGGSASISHTVVVTGEPQGWKVYLPVVMKATGK